MNMALMFPDVLPSRLAEDNRGETKLFNALKAQLNNDWIVYHNVYLHERPSLGSRQRDGEIDFVLSHPKLGILVIEVKGGVFISYVPEQDEWRSTDKGLESYKIHNPYNQARKNKYSLLETISRIKGWEIKDYKDLNDLITVGYCIAFPDVTRIHGNLPQYAVKEITLLEFDCNNLAKRIPMLMEYYRKNQDFSEALSKQIHHDLKAALAPLFVLDRSLIHWISDEEKEVFELTEEQYQLLDTLRYIKRASIYGCAGSGKTLLATKKAELMAASNQRTLLCCFNLILGDTFSKFSVGKVNLIANNFHSLIKVLLEPYVKEEYDIYDDQVLLDLVTTYDIPKFDCILIDEAQDFSSEQLDILQYLLKEDGVLYFFWDSNQKVIRGDINIPKDIPKFVLNTNLRNTNYIFKHVKEHYHQELDLRHKGPLGRAVVVCDAYKANSQQDLFIKLRHEVNNLIIQNEIRPQDITILSFKAKSKSILTEFTFNDIPISYFDDTSVQNSIRIDTVRRFKGMESPVIIVTEMDDDRSMKDPDLWDDMCYVSFSRAKNHLVILPPDNIQIK